MKDYSEIISASEVLRRRGHKIVLVTGCFDVLHVGHASLLNFAELNGIVFVGVNSDSAVKSLKGDSRPINNQADRMDMLDNISSVYFSFLIDDTTITEAITKIRPDFWVKGSDYTLETINQDERKAAESVGTKILFAPKVEGYSSTKIIEKLKQ